MVNDDIDPEHGNANLDKSGAGGNYCTKKSNCTDIKYKNVALKDNEPSRLHHAMGTKNQIPTSFRKLCHPTAIFLWYFLP